MNVIHDHFGFMAFPGRLEGGIAHLEEGLRSLPPTPYQSVIGRSFMHHVATATEFIRAFHRNAASKMPVVGTLYFEMNGLAINPADWHFHGFAYAKGGHAWDLKIHRDWLHGWELSSERAFPLTGSELVQSAFERLYLDEELPLAVTLAGEIAEHLVAARYYELIDAAVALARRIEPALQSIAILAAPHDWDCLYPTE